MYLKNTLAASALAIAAMTGGAHAATLSGTFSLDISNFNAGGNSANATATHSTILSNGFETFTYIGALDFRVGPGNSTTTTIADFFATGSGMVVGGLGALGDAIMSGSGYQETTVMEFYDFSGAIGGFAGNIAHDDGIQFFDDFVLEVDSNSPTPEINNAFDFSGNGASFELIYAAANGNPSVLEVTGTPSAVPLPAGLPLMLLGLGGLAAVRRRKS